ncbi:aromatic-ring-hydroxylating dioxygenase subunit beta [Pseudooceanicola sp. CBS1P-1]|uniref:Aromatic-ring-hydroxylating dioxygenase subunit beta n=1 Tax=Pseudooceanicola albus TaxID=2692189 RepID=A0A6L7G984_9RHOB|nr:MULTISPECIES: aromatic-ring-hydroxylating dioxygenase subunit beta [Pseudooceanicola]MBT9386496.1 aromatic-ring-hydroxylating dioxygenase subunit beta [Pseudooceanicola endophyticus]MXN20529.1 aromatic-ring-hydroxylating dioxygenase subunit beta [Pseudooceanicola albus]
MKDVLTDTEITLDAAVKFLWQEADILDRHDYAAWLPLWTEDGMYVIPTDTQTTDFANSLNIVYDDAEMRRMRAARLSGGFSISAAPPAQCVRTLSRFVIEDQAPGRITLRSALHVIEDKFGRQRLFAANVTHELVATEEGLKIAGKVVHLLNADGMLTSISYLF